MASGSTDASFIVWGIDQTAYGPVELPTLVSWVKDERITPETWIFNARDHSWQRASEVAELKTLFNAARASHSTSETVRGTDIQTLRQIKILEGMSNPQLERFSQFVEIEKVPKGTVIVRQGDYDNTMYLVLEGEISARMKAVDEEAVLSTTSAGDFFGDISLFDHGPRTANVVTNCGSVLVKITASAFQQMAKEAPDLATPFLLAIGKTLTARIRAGSKHNGEMTKARPAAEDL
jgi:CRP-like cAMP-binding protein